MQDGRIVEKPLLLFKRLDVVLERHSLQREFEIVVSDAVLQRLHGAATFSREDTDRLFEIGRRAADQHVSEDDFPAIFDTHLEPVE